MAHPHSLKALLILYALSLAYGVATLYPENLDYKQGIASTDIFEALLLLNSSIDGRVRAGSPLEQPCFHRLEGNIPNALYNASQCSQIESNFSSHLFRSSFFGGYMNTQWETCQALNNGCLLDDLNPYNPAALDQQCSQGSVPSYYIDVQGESDVIAAMEFSRTTGTPLVIKNTGHDFLGRSSRHGALALWTHRLNNLSYNDSWTDGCGGGSVQAITIGAGAQFQYVIDFAQRNNITVVTGSDTAVGMSGGWVQGGGHGFLTPTYGLGADNVKQFRLVTPDGIVRTANACNNPDLFFALRGGGGWVCHCCIDFSGLLTVSIGSTYGVVLESSHEVRRAKSLQVVEATYNATPKNVATLIRTLAKNAVQWSDDHWGGLVKPVSPGGVALFVNAQLNSSEAYTSSLWLQELTLALGGNFTIFEVESYSSFFNTFIAPNEDPSGVPFAMASRLIPANQISDEQLITTMTTAVLGVSLPQILVTTPRGASFELSGTSVTPAWREAVWHFTIGETWNYNSSIISRAAIYNKLEDLIEPIRSLTNASGAYMNEASVYEPNWKQSFWGKNYPALLSIKKKYDPYGILSCWRCVGWNDSWEPQFSCYQNILT